MFDIAWTEMLVIAIVLIVVVGPKELPGMLRSFGKTTAKLRVMANDFRRQFDEALKEAELDDIKKLAEDARKLNPAADIKKAFNPLEKAGNDVRAGLDAAFNPPKAEPPKPKPAATETSPAVTEAPKAEAAPAVSSATPAPAPAAVAPAPKTAAKAKKAPAKAEAAKPAAAKPVAAKRATIKAAAAKPASASKPAVKAAAKPAAKASAPAASANKKKTGGAAS